MKPFIAGVATLAGLTMAGLLYAQKELPFDFKLAESPRKPAPDWFKIIDQGDRDARLKGYFTPQGVKLEIAAEQPIVVNPIAMAFGDDGTLFVIERLPGEVKESEETITYKDGSKRQIACLKKSVKDVVKALRDTKNSGVFDEAKVVLEDDLPAGILVHDGWIYLSGQGTVRRYRQSQAGSAYDVKETIAKGFGGRGPQQVSGMTIGNDGWLYVSAGDGDHYVEGSDGSKATVLRTGAIFRCRPDGSKVHAYAQGFRNPYGNPAFDIGFQMFAIDQEVPDGGKFAGCRLIQVAETADYGWRRLASGQADLFRAAAWGEMPGRLTPMLKTGKGLPAGLMIYEENRFPEQFRGLVYYPDPLRQVVRAYQPRIMGSTFEITNEFEFLKSSDPLFRPCQMIVGPDGAMYVCDWRSETDWTQFVGNGKTGRIYRLSWAGNQENPALPLRPLNSWAKLREMAVPELQKAMESENQSDRLRAQRELVRRGGDEIRKALLKDFLDNEQETVRRLAALGALNSMWNADVKKACTTVVEGGPPDLRRLAAEALALNGGPGDLEIHSSLLRALADENPAARRAIALAMAKIGHSDAGDSLLSSFKFNRDIDPYLADSYLRALERLGRPGMEKLIDLAQSGDEKDFDRVVDAFLALRDREAAARIPELLKYPHVTPTQRARLLETYRHFLTDPPVPLGVVAEYLDARPEEPVMVKLAGLQTLALGGRLTGERIENLAIGLLDEQDPETRRTVIQILDAGQVKRAAPKLAGLLAEPNQFDAIHILKALRGLDDKSIVAVVKETALAALKDPPRPAIGVEALRTLAVLDAKVADEVVPAYLDSKRIELVREGVLTLGATPAGARKVGEALLAKKLPAEAAPQVIEVLKRHAGKDAGVAKLLAEVEKK